MSADTLQVRRGVAWVGLATSFVALFDILSVSLLLHFWVSSADYGTVTIVGASMAALTLLAEGGLPAAIIQRDDADESRLSTAYWLGFVFAGALYAILWLAAPGVARLFGDPVLEDLVRVYGVLLLLRALYTTQQAMLRRELGFKAIAGVRITANVVELAVKLGAAAGGLGLWCFVLGALSRELTYAIGIPLQLRWRPRLVCHPRRAVADLRFGLRANGGELLFQLYSNFDYLVVGYFFGRASLGVYRAAYELVLEPVRFLSGVVTVVAFPAFARLRADRAALVDQMVAFVRQNLLVVLPYLAIVTIAAEESLAIFVGRQYAVAGDAARVLAVVAILRSLSYLGPPLLDGVGRPGLTLRYQVTATILLSTLFVAFAAGGDTFLSVAIAWAVGYPLAFLLLAAMVLARLELRPGALLRPIARLVACVAAATACGAIAHAFASGLGTGARLGVTCTVVVVVAYALLATFDGFSPRAIARSLRR